MTLGECKQGQLVSFNLDDTTSYGIVLGVASSPIQNVMDVETMLLSHTRIGLYFLCKYESYIVTENFVDFLKVNVQQVLNDKFMKNCFQLKSVTNLNYVAHLIDEKTLNVWLLKNQMLNKSINNIISNLQNPVELMQQYNRMKEILNEYLHNEQVDNYLLKVKQNLKRKKQKVEIGNLVPFQVYLREYKLEKSFVIPLDNGNFLKIRFETQQETSLILTRALHFYLTNCYISSDFEKSNLQLGNYYDLKISVLDLEYNKLKVKELMDFVKF